MRRPIWHLTPPGRIVGRRGRCLLFFGGLDVVYAWSLYFPVRPLTPTYRWFREIMPLQNWALVWLVVGVLCLWYAFQHYDRPAFVAAIGIKVVWGVLSIAGWVLDDLTVLFGAIWLGLAGLVWTIAGWSEPEEHGQDAV